MRLNFNALPALIALAVLVTVFAAISRHRTRERVNLWLTGWTLILLRSLVEFVRFKPHWASKLELVIGLCALELASVAFVVSVAPRATTRLRQLVLALVLGVPACTYTVAMLLDISARSFYYTVIGVALLGALVLLWTWYRAITMYVVSISLGIIGLGALMVWAIAAGKQDYGVHFVLAALNFFAAGLYWYRFRRASAGVLTAVFGFAAWGLTFPAGILLSTLGTSVRIESEVWNIPKYLVAVGMIVTLLEDQIRESEHLAYHDALTGLPNRRLLRDRLLQAIAHADRSGHKVAVLLLDLDDFKDVNDTFGHRIGDAALQQVVLRLSSRMRASDTLARTGGDEFTVVSEITSAQGAQTLASALESALLLPIKVDGKLVRTGVSVGYALYPEDGTDPIELCSAADKAMYASKRGIRLA
jgi:diguanylate cyclase (GGDEF)-like protein